MTIKDFKPGQISFYFSPKYGEKSAYLKRLKQIYIKKFSLLLHTYSLCGIISP